MFNTITNTAIDAVQTGKKQFVTTFVRHETLADTINKFVDIETTYSKAVIDNASKTFSDFYTILTNKDFAKEIKESYTVPNIFNLTEKVKSKTASKKAE